MMDLQRANGWKRIAAWVLDIMLLCVLTVGVAYGFSAALGYDAYMQTVQEGYEKYSLQYGVDLDMDQETYDAMSDAEKADYQAKIAEVEKALNEDEAVKYASDMCISYTVLIITFSILLATVLLEFVLPLILKNGQTVGKKCFSLGVVRIDGVKVNTMQMFTRTLLGKYTIERMIPVYVALMWIWAFLGQDASMALAGSLLVILILIMQIICVAVGRNRAAIHDRLAGTVVVDIASQKIFENTEELIAYTNRIHAERAKHQPY